MGRRTKGAQPATAIGRSKLVIIENFRTGRNRVISAAAKASLVGKMESNGIDVGGSDPNDRHFRTDHLLANLKGRTISSGFVTIAAQGAKFVLTLASIVVLARLLTPQDFGLVAMVTAVTNLLFVLRDAGLSTATVQREGITHAQVSNLFWVNVVLGALTSLVIAGLAPAIAWFYREPRLLGITMVLSMTFLLRGSIVQHMALLNRQMR
jgi:Polysaccharide biosynthesis protein